MTDFYEMAGMTEMATWVFESHMLREMALKREHVRRRRAMIRLAVSNMSEPVL